MSYAAPERRNIMPVFEDRLPSQSPRLRKRILLPVLSLAVFATLWYALGRRGSLSIDVLHTNDSGTDIERPRQNFNPGKSRFLTGHKKQDTHTTTVVAGRLASEESEASWITEKLHDVTRRAVYVVDDSEALLHLEKNHGRESAVYLQYIIDHYHNLTDVTFFMHAHAVAPHNNLLLRQDSAATINLAKRQYITEQGYVNTRCDLNPGCPQWIKFNPTKAQHELHMNRLAELFGPEKWTELYPDTKKFPEYLSAPCCSQFAVTRDVIQGVSIATYKRLLKWLQEDPWDGFTGRFMEYTWAYLFLGAEELCPAIGECYCELYGVCVDDVGMLEKWQSSMTRATDLDDITIAMGVYETDGRSSESISKESRAEIEQQLAAAREEVAMYEKSLYDGYAIKLPGRD